MTQHGVRQNALAAHTGRSHGFVSEHLSGRRAVDTDTLDAVAQLAGMDTIALVTEVTRRMAAAGDPSARRHLTAAELEQAEVDDAMHDYDRGYSEISGQEPHPSAERDAGQSESS